MCNHRSINYNLLGKKKHHYRLDLSTYCAILINIPYFEIEIRETERVYSYYESK